MENGTLFLEGRYRANRGRPRVFAFGRHWYVENGGRPIEGLTKKRPQRVLCCQEDLPNICWGDMSRTSRLTFTFNGEHYQAAPASAPWNIGER